MSASRRSNAPSRRGEKRRGARKRGKKGKKKERNSRFSRLTFRLRGFRLSGFYATGGIGLVVHLDQRRQRQCFSSRERRKAVNNRFSYATIYARSRNELRRCYFRSKERGREEPPVISSINNLDDEDTWRRLIAYVNQPIPIIKSTVIPDIEVETRSLMSLFLTDSAFDRRRKSRSF